MIYPALPNAKVLIGDKGYDSDEFRNALNARKIKACIPPRSNRTVPRHYSKTLYKQRHKIENMFSTAEGLAAHCNQIRPVSTYIHVSNLYCGNRHLLDQSMSPDPNV